MKEIYFSGDNERAAYVHQYQPPELYAMLQEKFPWVRQENYFSISEPSYHEVLEEPVITCNLPYPAPKRLVGDHAAMVARKFCMNSLTSFMRVYTLSDGAKPIWMPESASWLGVGENFEEFGRPFNQKAKSFKDYYFGGDPEVIEAHFNLPQRRGSYDTWYGATVVGDQVVRVKQYCYDQQSVFSDWEVAYIALSKRINGTGEDDAST